MEMQEEEGEEGAEYHQARWFGGVIQADCLVDRLRVGFWWLAGQLFLVGAAVAGNEPPCEPSDLLEGWILKG